MRGTVEHVKYKKKPRQKTKDKTAEGTSRNERKTTSRRRERPMRCVALRCRLVGYATHPTWLINLVTCW